MKKMKNYIRRNEIKPGEYTEIDGSLYIAVERNRRVPCLEQCDCTGFFGRRYCTGFCFRWDHDGDIVFKKAETPKGNFDMIITPLS